MDFEAVEKGPPFSDFHSPTNSARFVLVPTSFDLGRSNLAQAYIGTRRFFYYSRPIGLSGLLH